VDLSKAFYTVDHAILLNKLSLIGPRSDSCSCFNDYLSDRTQAIMIDGVTSEFLDVLKGVPQGSILGPVFFTINIKTIGQSVKNVKLNLYMWMILLCMLLPRLLIWLCQNYTQIL
jgi:hypothetical protein